MRHSAKTLAILAAALSIGLASCEVQDFLGDCEITTDSFASSYGPNDQRTHPFTVGCPGAISVFWTCPQCPDPNAGRLLLRDPVGNVVFQIDGAGFSGRNRTTQTLLEGRWSIVLQGTGGNFTNNYRVDVTYPGI
jgi:hypothetical protein